MTEKQQEAIAMLNEMYCSQSKDYQFQYKRNYFALVEFIMGEQRATMPPGWRFGLAPVPDFELQGRVLSPEELMEEQLTAAECADEPMLPLEKGKIMNVLQLCGGDRKKAAQMLGISDRTLYRRLKQYGLE
jgi:DNA-binding NtrC family response regulator